MGDAFKIESLTAFLSVGSDGEEGVCAFRDDAGHWMPMIAGDYDRVTILREKARAIAAITGLRIVVARFDQRTDLEEIL